ncbi:anthranilate synthase component I family protein [Paenibacillus sp. y28]|uniref:anthranilate synthase component I family protein n=1 Tax=Paenibacillus sp. y28 TaxID=3129110 RepID=UPI003016B339
MLPYVRSFPLDEVRPASWEAVWNSMGKTSFVLESGKGGRYSFLGVQPRALLEGKAGEAVLTEFGSGQSTDGGDDPFAGALAGDGKFRRLQLQGKPLELLKRWMNAYRGPRVEGLPKFIGGCVGFLSYDVVRSLERLPSLAADDLPLPEYAFMLMDKLWIVDHQQKLLYCAVHTPITPDVSDAQLEAAMAVAEQEAGVMHRRWTSWMTAARHNEQAGERLQYYHSAARAEGLNIDVDALPGLERHFSREQFIHAVRRIQEYIAQGDVFQVNLSVRQSCPLRLEPEEVYEWLRLLNPSPYMGLLRYPGYTLVSGSPELLVKVEGGEVSTRPIAGTRPRGSSEAEDRLMAEELIGHEKERAEHIMLVDLLRNDLGRVSRYGSVRVDELMVIEYYSHVMHIVSEVKGELAEGKDGYDALAAAFPGGTITGAPKIRTMEIIEELEPVRRGPYTGSIGWIDYSGNMEFNITIRTLVAAGGKAHIQAGAGIVIDSVPEKEYAESISKAKALWKALQLAEQFRAQTGSKGEIVHDFSY